MGKKKGKNRQRNLQKQPQHDERIREDPPVETAAKADDIINTNNNELNVNKINSLRETAINEIISMDVGSKLENISSTSEAEKEGLKSATSEIVQNKESLEEGTQVLDSKSTECLSVIGNSAIKNNSTSSNSEELKGDEIQRFLGTKPSCSTLLCDESEQGTVMRETSLLTKKESETTLGEEIESNINPVEQETTTSVSNSERENTFLTQSNDILDIKNSVQESVIGKSNQFSDPDSETLLEESDKTTEMTVNKTASILDTGSLNLATVQSAHENISLDKIKSECLVALDEAISINNMSRESDFEMKAKLSESPAEIIIEPSDLVNSKNNDSDGNVINNINEILTESLNIEKSERKCIIRDSRSAEKECLNETVKNENSQEEKNRFSIPIGVVTEDATISDKIVEKPDPAIQPELKVLASKTGKKSMVPKSKSTEDKLPSKQDSKKTNRKNKKSGLNKSKTTLENSPDNEENVQLHNNVEKHTVVQDSPLPKSNDYQEDASFQLGLRNSISPEIQTVNLESSLDESKRSTILDSSKSNDTMETERLDTIVRPVIRDSEITLFQEGHDTSILTNTSSITNHGSLETILEDKNHVQIETDNCPVYLPLSQMVENQMVQEVNPSSCGRNEVEDNIDTCTGSSEEATSNISNADKIPQCIGKNQQLTFEVDSNFSATDTEFKSSEVDIETNLPLEVTKAMEKHNEPEILTKDERLNPENSNIDASSLLKMHNDLHEEASEAVQSKEEHQTTNRPDSTTKELISLANQDESEGNETIPCNDKETEECIRKNSKDESQENGNGKTLNKEKVADLSKEQLHHEKAANSNMGTVLSKKKSRLHKCQKKDEKGQASIKMDGNVPCKDKANNENKNVISANSEEGSESKRSKNKSKSASISTNVKVGGNGAIGDSRKLISKGEKTNTFITANNNDSTAEKKLPHEAMKESRLLHADSPFETVPVRPIFMANTCHVCKQTHGGEIRLKSCSACRLIAYCGKEHQKKHWKEHKSICQQVQKSIKRNNLQDLYGNACKIKGPEEWRIYRCLQLTETEKMIGRPLLPYEREMFLYPRVCSVCRKSDPEKLKVCKQCHYINYCCSEHLPKTHHNWCKELKLLLEINQYQSNYGLIRPQIPLIKLDKSEQFPKDMKTFISTSLSIEKNTNIYNLYESTLSDIASYPLTVLYVLECLSKENVKGSFSPNKLTIHIVGAERQFEVDTLSKWDAFLLNLLPTVAELHLVFIGPELMPSDTSEINDNSCTKMSYKSLDATKKFFTEFHYGKLYHEYVKESTFSKPDIICAFNCGIYRYTGFDNQDTWGPTILSMVKHKYTPIVLTAYTEVEAPKDVHRFKKECSVQVVIPPSKNPFASMKPNLNFVSDDETPLIYKNQYLSVLQGVDSESNNQ